jgi:hypothetical protein
MKSINVYKFNELTEKAQLKVWENSAIDFSDDYAGEYLKTLHAFEKAFDIRVYDYRVGDSAYSLYFKYVRGNTAADAPAGDPFRVARYVWNNFAPGILKGKYYSTPGKWIDGRYTYKHRHSKIILDMYDCPLTGCYTDGGILQPVIDCLHYKEKFSSYDELVNASLESFFATWQKDIEYCNSFEYFQEWALENDSEWYTENGEQIKGVA